MDINKISNRTIFRILAMVLAFIVLAMLVKQAQRPLVWLGSAFFLALALNPAVEWLGKYMPRKSRGLAAGLVFLVTVLVVVVTTVTLVPPLVSQTQSLSHDVPSYIDSLQNSNSSAGKLIQRYNLLPQVRSYGEQLSKQVAGAGGSLFNFVGSVFSSFVALLTTMVLTFFMLTEGPRWVKLFWMAQPSDRRKHRQDLAMEMYEAINGYVTGNLLTSLIAAVVSMAIMAIIGLPFAIPLGILVGVFDLIPLVGATLGSIVITFIALFHSVTAAIIMAVFFLIYQQLENHVLQPLVYSRTVKMTPLTVLVSGIIGATLGGLIGALVAIPVAASLQILIKDYYLRHHSTKTKA